MTQDEVVAILEQYQQELSGILSRFTKTKDRWYIHDYDYARYRELVTELMDLFNDELVDGQHYSHQLIVYANESITNWSSSPSYRGVENVKGLVAAILARVKRNPRSLKQIAQSAAAMGLKNPDDLYRLAERFHLVARQLRERHGSRTTLEVEDEYDVQDLFHSLLMLYFDDIRKEEWAPSYAGGASRIDFVLPELEMVLEIKKTRPSLSTKELGEQLIVDIVKYQKHPLCRTLFCFVYDPEGRVADPRGVENDLNDSDREIAVRVMIVPKGF
jgi:hypothetical protein